MKRSIVGVRFAAPVLVVAALLAAAAPAQAATRFVAPAGSESASCTRSAPCGSLSRAYRAAAPGDTVQLADGTYDDTSLPLDTTKEAAQDVVFKPAAGATPRFSDALRVRARNVELRGMQLQDTLHIDASAQNVTVRESAIKNFQVFSSGTQAPRNISFIGGSAGPSVDDNNRIASERDVDDGVADEHPDRRHGDPRLHAERGLRCACGVPAGLGRGRPDDPEQSLPQLRGVRRLPAEAARRRGARPRRTS